MEFFKMKKSFRFQKSNVTISAEHCLFLDRGIVMTVNSKGDPLSLGNDEQWLRHLVNKGYAEPIEKTIYDQFVDMKKSSKPQVVPDTMAKQVVTDSLSQIVEVVNPDDRIKIINGENAYGNKPVPKNPINESIKPHVVVSSVETGKKPEFKPVKIASNEQAVNVKADDRFKLANEITAVAKIQDKDGLTINAGLSSMPLPIGDIDGIIPEKREKDFSETWKKFKAIKKKDDKIKFIESITFNGALNYLIKMMKEEYVDKKDDEGNPMPVTPMTSMYEKLILIAEEQLRVDKKILS